MTYTDIDLKQQEHEDVYLLQEECNQLRMPRLDEYYFKLLRLFLCRKSAVLDINPGTADLSVYLARQGFRPTLLCRSSKVLNLARAKLCAAGEAADFDVGSMRSFHWQERFNAAIAKHFLPYVFQPYEATRFFCDVYASLSEYGLLLFDFYTVSAFSKESIVYNLNLLTKVFQEQRLIPGDKAARIDWYMTGPHYTTKARNVCRIYDVRTMSDLLEAAGFRGVRFFDATFDTEGTSLPEATENSAVIMCVARKVSFEAQESEFGPYAA